jgi:hypothetical protein
MAWGSDLPDYRGTSSKMGSTLEIGWRSPHHARGRARIMESDAWPTMMLYGRSTTISALICATLKSTWKVGKWLARLKGSKRPITGRRVRCDIVAQRRARTVHAKPKELAGAAVAEIMAAYQQARRQKLVLIE